MNDRAKEMVAQLTLGLAELDGFIAAETSKPSGAEHATPFSKIDEVQNAVGRLIVLTRGLIAVLQQLAAEE